MSYYHFILKPVDSIVSTSENELIYFCRLLSFYYKYNLNVKFFHSETFRYKKRALLCFPALCLILGQPRVFGDKPLSNSTLLHVLDITNTH